MEKVNRCPKDISLENILKDFYWKRKKEINFFTAFYISHEIGVKTF